MASRWLLVWAALGLVLGVRTAGAAPAATPDDFRVRGALAALHTGDRELVPLAIQTLTELQATSAFDDITAAGRELLDDEDARGALALALGELQTHPQESIQLLLEILQREHHEGSFSTCGAFARWLSSGRAQALALMSKAAPPAGVDLGRWYQCVGVWTAAGVDALLTPALWEEKLGRAAMDKVAPSLRPGMARKLLDRLGAPGASTVDRAAVLEQLGRLGDSSPQVLDALDKATAEDKLRDAAEAALARLLPTAPAGALPEDRLIRLSRGTHTPSLLGPLLVRSPRLQRELVTRIEAASFARCPVELQQWLRLPGPGPAPAPLVAAMTARLTSAEDAARTCAAWLTIAVLSHSPELAPPLRAALPHLTEDRLREEAMEALVAAGAGAQVVEELIAHYRSLTRYQDDFVSDKLAGAALPADAAGRVRAAMMTKLLTKEHAYRLASGGWAAAALGPSELPEALQLIERTYDGALATRQVHAALRFWAIVLTGGAPPALLATTMDVALRPGGAAPTPDAAIATARAALAVLGAKPGPNVAARTYQLLRNRVDDTAWRAQDAGFLRELLEAPELTPPALAPIRAAISRQLAQVVPAEPSWLRRAWGWALATLGTHFLIWLAMLLTVYPRWRLCQSAMLFNPLGRAVTGWGYTQLLILASARLRSRLFRPLLEREQRAEPTPAEEAFHDQIQVAPLQDERHAQLARALGKPAPWTSLVAAKGLVLIEGESGVGKTLVLRALLARARAQRRTCLLLRAADCGGGVTKLIEQTLAMGHSSGFVDSLLHSGAIELYLDGFNEAPPSAVAEITSFCNRAHNARIFITSQPMRWAYPKRARVMRLLPLLPEQLRPFLRAQWPAVAAGMDQAAYDERVEHFLAVRGPGAGTARELEVLCNRFELAFIAHLLARGQEPDLHALRKQVVDDAARAYAEAAPGGTFPMAALARAAIKVLETGHPLLDLGGVDAVALQHLGERKLLLQRGDGAWVFRHESVAAYFAAQGFFAPLITAERIDERAVAPAYVSSQRFRSVYLQLAESVPLPAAEQLALALRDFRREHAGDPELDREVQNVLDRRRKSA